MKALCWQGTHSVAVKNVPFPKILNPKDAIVEVTLSSICGSDLHLYDGFVPTMEKGDILGHETMGRVIEVGPMVQKIKIGDKIVIPFNIACGNCGYCQKKEFSACDNSNPNSNTADQLYGYSGAGLFGFSHLHGGYAGGQAEFIRVPYADQNSLVVPDDIEDEKVLFLSDIFPTGYMAAENCAIKRGDTVAVWGAGPVAQMAIRSAFLLGAERVIAIDHYPARLELAKEAGADVIHFDEVESVHETLKYLTGGRGPDSCIDAVGMEAHGHSLLANFDKVKTAIHLATDRPDALRQAIHACKKGGTVSIAGVYGGFLDKVPFGAAFEKGLSFKMGQTHTQKYMEPLLGRILKDEINPATIITHRIDIDEGPSAYKLFHQKKDECIKVVIKMH